MAIILNEPVRICKITTTGPVAALGGISGPIKKCKLTNKQIITIMRSGHKIEEYNPNNSRESIELKLDNNGESPFVEEKEVQKISAPTTNKSGVKPAKKLSDNTPVKKSQSIKVPEETSKPIDEPKKSEKEETGIKIDTVVEPDTDVSTEIPSDTMSVDISTHPSDDAEEKSDESQPDVVEADVVDETTTAKADESADEKKEIKIDVTTFKDSKDNDGNKKSKKK